MRRNVQTDWALLFAALKNDAIPFSIILGMGLICGAVGAFVLVVDEGYHDIGQLLGGGFFAAIGVAIVVTAFVTSWSSVGYYYHQALLRKHGVKVNAVLTRKEAQCQLDVEYDRNNKPLGTGSYQCDLYLEFDFQFDGRNHSSAAFISKAEVFDKLKEGDQIPLIVLRMDPTTHKVRERKLSNNLKSREPESPSQIPDGAEISR
ncbi:DUF3592 domain-containing protein [Marinobacter sp. 1Y8]